MSDPQRTPHDREIDLIAVAESIQLQVSDYPNGYRDPIANLLHGILCATTATARMLYNQTPDAETIIPRDTNGAPMRRPPAGPTEAELRAFYEWANTHRLVVGADGKTLADVHLTSIPPFFAEGQPRVEVARGVHIVHDGPPLPCPEGPHACPTSNGKVLAYCRRSCTACSGNKVRPCFYVHEVPPAPDIRAYLPRHVPEAGS